MGDILDIGLPQAKRIINALRTGVIPDADLEILNVGRDREIAELNRCIENAAGGDGVVKFIAGEYGSGKSFMLSLVRQLAVKNNLLVSRIQINKGFYLNNMETLYYNVMHNLLSRAIDASGTDFEDIFGIWISRLQAYDSKEYASNEIKNVIASLNNYNSSFARAFLTYIRAKIGNDTELSSAAASWIKGEKNVPAALKAKFEVKGEIDRQNSIDFLKAFVNLVTLLGFKGMVILIDELELIMSTRSDIRRSCYENLRYIIDASGAGEFNKCMFIFAGTNEIFEDEEKGVKTYYSLYQRLGNLSGRNVSVLPDARQPVMHLRKLSLEDLHQLTDRITAYHMKAYNWTPKNSSEAIKNWVLVNFKKEKNSVFPVNTREYVTKLVNILDVMEQNPENNIYNSELKMINKDGVITFVNGGFR